MVTATETYYQILGIDEDATPDQVATARRSMLKAVHPDLATDEADRVERERLSRTVNDMCDTLLDPIARWDYDRALVRDRHGPAPRSGATADGAAEEWDDPAFQDARWEPESARPIHIPGLDWLDQWLTWRVAGLTLLMLGLSTLVYATVGGRLLDRIGLHFGRFGSLAVVLSWTVLLVLLCVGVARWVRARRTGRG